MRIFLSGAAGLVGHSVLAALLGQGYIVTVAATGKCLGQLAGHPRLRVLRGTMTRQETWVRAAADSDVIVLLSGLENTTPSHPMATKEHLTREGILNSVATGRPRRVIFVSSLGARPDAPLLSQRNAWSIEEAVRRSHPEHVILRPAWIFSRRDRPVVRLVRALRYMPFVPVVGDPDRTLQPVDLENVLEGIVKAVRLPSVASRTYDVGGPRIYTQREVVNLFVEALGKRPGRQRYVSEEMGQRFRWVPFILPMVPPWMTGDVCNPHSYFRDFCIRPIRFEQRMRMLAKPLDKIAEGELRVESYVGADGTKEW